MAIGASLKKKIKGLQILGPNNFSTQFDSDVIKSDKDNKDI